MTREEPCKGLTALVEDDQAEVQPALAQEACGLERVGVKSDRWERLREGSVPASIASTSQDRTHGAQAVPAFSWRFTKYDSVPTVVTTITSS